MATKNSIKKIVRNLGKPRRIKYWWDEVKLGIRNSFRKNSAKKIMLANIGALLLLFIVAIFYHNLGLFVVSVEPQLQQEGFAISDTADFSDPRVKLFGDALEHCNNITFNDLPTDIDEYEGEHNGKHYVAYTFFLKNGGKEKMDYKYELVIEEVSKDVDDATWIMVIMNGEAKVYAKSRADGTPERIYNVTGYPYISERGTLKQVNQITESYKGLMTQEDLDQFRYLESDGLYEFATIPFESNNSVTSGERFELEPEETDKYTIVVWLEGEDPQCVDKIKGGVIGLGMKFTRVTE